MMSVKMKVNKKEIDRLTKFMILMQSKTAMNLKKEMFKAANEFRNNVIRSMKNTAKDTTKNYPRGNKVHYPSRVGFPPAIDTGNAINSMKVRGTAFGAEYYIFGAPYMEWHEFGINHQWSIKVKSKNILSDNKSFFGKEVVHPGLPERPFIRPQIRRSQKTWEKMFKKTVYNNIQRFS